MILGRMDTELVRVPRRIISMATAGWMFAQCTTRGGVKASSPANRTISFRTSSKSRAYSSAEASMYGRSGNSLLEWNENFSQSALA